MTEYEDRYVDIRVRFKRITESDDPHGEYAYLEPVSITRQHRHYLNDSELSDIEYTIWENDDWQEKFVNGTLAALHGQETLF